MSCVSPFAISATLSLLPTTTLLEQQKDMSTGMLLLSIVVAKLLTCLLGYKLRNVKDVGFVVIFKPYVGRVVINIEMIRKTKVNLKCFQIA